MMTFAFYRTKQPSRIKEVLNMVYASPANVDEDLVTSISVRSRGCKPAVPPRVVLYCTCKGVKSICNK